jgi:hypothetical protein
MKPCNKICYFTVHWKLNTFRAAHLSSSGALTVLATFGLHTIVVTATCQLPHAYVNQRLQIELELLMMSGVPLKTCWAFNERLNNKFYYKEASCWLLLLSHCSSSFDKEKTSRYCPGGTTRTSSQLELVYV